jgi:hypothetical protein
MHSGYEIRRSEQIGRNPRRWNSLSRSRSKPDLNIATCVIEKIDEPRSIYSVWGAM